MKDYEGTRGIRPTARVAGGSWNRTSRPGPPPGREHAAPPERRRVPAESRPMTPAAPSAGDAGGSSGAGRGRRGGDADASGGAAGREGRAAGAADQDESRDAGRVSHGSEPATERDGGIDGQAAAGDAPDTEADGAGPCDPGSEAEVEMRAALAEVAVLFALRDALADAAPRRAALASEVQRYLGADPRPALESLRDRGLVEHIEAADLWRPVKGVA